MRDKVSIEQLSKIPFVTHVPSDGRIVSLQPFHDRAQQKWLLYLPLEGELQLMDGGEPVTGSYFSTQAVATGKDYELELGTLVAQHLSFPGVLTHLERLESDVHRCAAVLHKYHLISQTRNGPSLDAQLLVESELEYLLFLLRAFYDLLQRVIKGITSLLIALDGSGKRVLSKELKDSFADVALSGDNLRTLDEIVERWSIPLPLAQWYVHESSFFRELRTIRDGVAHHGRNPPSVLFTDWGFAIDPNEHPWNRFDAWPSDQRWDGRLGSLRAVFVGFIQHSLTAASRFASVIRQMVKLPPAVLGSAKFYIRDPFGHYLLMLEQMRIQPWEGKDPR